MLLLNPVRLLVKLPVPVPTGSEVFELEMVGFGEVLQHTPRAVIAVPPSLVIVPPQVAEEKVKLFIVAVDIVGGLSVPNIQRMLIPFSRALGFPI